MATYPPPFNPRDQVRAQVRAQRDAYRAQRDYWRAQRRPSIVRPLLFIVAGVVALLIETDRISGAAFWEWYVRWWPLLLIALGVLSLGEWWLERDQPYGRRSFGGGIIFWIVVLAALGSVSHGVRHSRGWDWFQRHNGGDDMGWHMFGEEHDADVNLDQAVPANAAVRVKNPHGDVTIATSTDGHVHVIAHDVVYASSDKEADKQLASLVPRLTVSGSDVLLQALDLSAAHADLTIDLPAGASLDIDAGHGDVSVEGTTGVVKVSAGHGDIRLTDLAGAVTAHMSKGDFSAKSLAGTLNLDGRMNDVTLTDMKNNVALNGEFFGDMHFAQLAAPLYMHSSRTEITIANIPGNLTLTDGDMDFSNVKGPIRIATHSFDVEGTTVSGPTHIENSNGDITLNVVSPMGEIDIHNNKGAVDLTLPAKTGFQLDASTNDGELSTDFDVPTRGDGDKHSASGAVGTGGPRVSVVVEHGDVHIKKAGSVSASEDGEQPEQPEKPEKPVRHLHAHPTDEAKPAVQ